MAVQLELGAAESTKNGNHRPKEMELGHKTALYGVRDITTFNVFRTPSTMSLKHSIRNTAIRRGRRAATSKVLPGKGFRIYNCRPRSTNVLIKLHDMWCMKSWNRRGQNGFRISFLYSQTGSHPHH